MSLRRKPLPDSLYMLLDTMCNAFGGIILLAVLVTLLTSKEVGGTRSADSHDLAQQRLAIAEKDLEDSLRLAGSLEARNGAWATQVDLLAARKQLQASLAQIQSDTAKTVPEINAPNAMGAAERIKALNLELAAAETSKLDAQNALAGVNENTKRLKQRLDALKHQTTLIINGSQRALRLPHEHDTGKNPFYIIAQYGRIYPCRNSDMSRNESLISWTLGNDRETAKPIPGRGYDPVSNPAEFQSFLNSLPRDLFYVAFCIYEDSFPQFNRAKQLATDAGLAYGWEPLRTEEGPVTFSSKGHNPKPQ